VARPINAADTGKKVRTLLSFLLLLKPHSLPPIRRLLFGPGTDALSILRALFEPFDTTQDKLRELVRSPSGVCPLLLCRTGRQWFWVLLPKQKDLGRRAETRHHQKSREHGSSANTFNVFHLPTASKKKP